MIKPQDVAVSKPCRISFTLVERVHDGISLMRMGQPETVSNLVDGDVEEF